MREKTSPSLPSLAEALVPPLEPLRIGVVDPAGMQRAERLPVHALQAVPQHRAVNLGKKLGIDLDSQVRTDPDEALVVRGVVDLAVAVNGFCEDMSAWVAALQEYQQVVASSPGEAAAVAEMKRLNPLIADRVDIPPLVDALEDITAPVSTPDVVGHAA
jgi:hypothetical protein